MTNQHTERKRTVAGIALAAVVFSGALVFTGALAAQTAEEPQVVFRVRMVQAERAATDKLAAERVTLSKADFNTNETINVHILNETADVVALVNGEASRSTLDVLGVPTLSTRNGEETIFLVGARKQVPTEPDTLGAGDGQDGASGDARRTAGPPMTVDGQAAGPLMTTDSQAITAEGQALAPETLVPPPPDGATEGVEKPAFELSERDFGLQLNLHPVVLPNGLIRVRLRPQVTAADFGNATLYQGRYVPALVTRQIDVMFDVKPGQTIALTGLLNDDIAQQLRRSAGAADEDLLLKQLLDARAAKTGTDLVLLVTAEIVGEERR